MSSRILQVNIKEKGYKEVDKKITAIQNKTKKGVTVQPKGMGKLTKGLDILKSKFGELGGVGGKTLGSMTSAVSGLSNGVGGATKMLTGLAGAFAIVGVAVGTVVQRLYSMTKAWASQTEAMMLSAQKAGLATKEFQALEQAGKEYNFTQANVIAGMAKLRQQAQKTGDTRSTAELFRETADMVKNANSETEALNIAVERLGRSSGPEMIAMLKGGSAELDKYIEKTEKIRIDDKTQASVLAFQDVMNNAGVAMEGIKVTFMKDIIEPMISFAEKLWEMIIPFLEGVMSIITPIIRAIMLVVNIVMGQLVPYMDILSTALDGIGIVIDMIVIGWELIVKIIKGVIDDTVKWLKQFKLIEKIFKGIAKIWGKVFGKEGKKDREDFRKELQRFREEQGLTGPKRDLPKTRTPGVIGDVPAFTTPTLKRGSTGSRGSGLDLITVILHFQHHFLMFARRLLELQERATMAGSSILGGIRDISVEVNVTAGVGQNARETGQQIGTEVANTLRELLKSNQGIRKSIDLHRNTVEQATKPQPGAVGRVTPAPNPVPNPIG